MENLYLIFSIVGAVITIIAVIKFFQMASDIRALRRHFVKELSRNSIGFNEEITGTLKGGGITYVVTNGSTKFSDGKVGYIKYLPDGQCAIPIMGDKMVFADVYYAAEALYHFLKERE